MLRAFLNRDAVSPNFPLAQPGRRLSALEILKLPREEQDRLLEEAAIKAEYDYRNDPDLTDFEAFGGKDLFDETPV